MERKWRYANRIEEVPNRYDTRGRAFKVTLSCGHSCILTGSRIMNLRRIDCKTCGGTGEDEHYS